MPITKSGDIITIEYQAGDSKGDSYANPYTLDDIYDAAVANGWTEFTKHGASVYLCGYGLKINGSSTYFWDYGKIVVFTKVVSTYFYFLELANNPHFRSGKHTVSGSYLYDDMMIWYKKETDNHPGYNYFSLIGYVELYNTNIYNLRIVNLYGLSGSNAIAYNCEIYCSSTLVINQYSDIQNCKFVGGSIGTVDSMALTVNTSPAQLVNIDLHKALFYSNFLEYCYAKNIRFYNDSYVKFYLTGGLDKALVLCDSNSPHDINLASYYTAQDARWYFKLNSTFSFNIANGSGANIKVYDKYDNLVLNYTLTSETYETELTYWQAKCEHFYDGATPNTYKTITEFQPFRLEISKQGYQTFELQNVYVVDGVPTQIRAKLKLLPLDVSSLWFTHPTVAANDGTITIQASGGLAPYEYSIDGGETWQSSGEFTGLPQGTYQIVVKDAEDTEVSGMEVVLKAPQYYSDELSGTITDDEITGSVEVIELTGTIS